MVKKEKSAGAIIYFFENEPKFLLLKNTLKTTYWEFPKGKIEENENIDETAIREVEEETELDNLEIIPGFKESINWFFRFQGELISKEAVYLLVKIPKEDKNKVKINKEHQDFSWLSFKEAQNKIKIKSNKELLKKAYEFILEYEKQKKLF